ncbi:hypothetical protein JMM81_08115 [Bacillus sp. V3B]|uniref:hypothetical protein n=1 Tax=Bacillus sp. V3B TaxID=2804915 RepID=UPI00210D3B14|nr:hypothetical protein [Bacillus sp. V3B]MCQ6274927.1 hypothetical protein [Bacillus sp. V3B]
MAITLPHIEDSTNTTYFPPNGEYLLFEDDSHYTEKVKEWGLSTTKEVKKQFWYKERTYQRLVTIKGYEVYGVTSEFNTVIIEFQDGNLSCIHPAYLKEMQSPNFMKANISDTNRHTPSSPAQKTKKSLSSNKPKANSNQKQAKEKKERLPKLELPEEKVHFTATVKQFALSWNNFNEENDEVVVLENVVIQLDNPIDVELAWCSHSKTLKKFELQPGEVIEFDGKIVKKKLPKGKEVEAPFIVEVPVPYKINNPSKLKKI